MHSASVLKEEERLQSVDNFMVWERAIQAALLLDGRLDHILKDASELAAKVNNNYGLSLVPTAAESSKLRVALHSLARERQAAFSTVYNGLTKLIQNKLPTILANFTDPQPKVLFEYIKKTYGANLGTQQAELWASIWTLKIAKSKDPGPKLSDLTAKIGEIGAAASAITVQEFAKLVGTYAAIHALPSSYGLLASTFTANTMSSTGLITPPAVTGTVA